MARVSRRKAQHVEVPALEQDAAERKRVLNILAQRRYRERKRQRYEELENRVKNKTSDHSDASTPSEGDSIECGTANVVNDSCVSLEPDFDLGPFATTDVDQWDTNVLFPSIASPMDLSKSSFSTTSYDSGNTSNSPLASVDGMQFPDEMYLPMIEINIIRAGLAIAKCLDMEDVMWDLTALSIFNRSTRLNYDHLPANFRPTLTQLTTPHHPMLDMLPWPEVRDKLILIFSLPEGLRPPAARSPTALVGFAYDMEDSTEGIRVTGDDPYASDNWELGQKVFERWWWAFTSEIVDHSNAVRQARGATALTGMILGELT